MHRQTHPNGRGHWLFDQVNLARSGVRRRIFDRAFLDLRNSRRHCYHDTWSDQLSVMNLLDKMTEHRLSNLEICDDAVFHWPDGHNIAGGAAQHAFGLFPDGQNVGGACLNGNYGGFSQYNALVTYIDQRVCRSQIDTDIVGKQALNLREHERCLTRPQVMEAFRRRSSRKRATTAHLRRVTANLRINSRRPLGKPGK